MICSIFFARAFSEQRNNNARRQNSQCFKLKLTEVVYDGNRRRSRWKQNSQEKTSGAWSPRWQLTGKSCQAFTSGRAEARGGAAGAPVRGREGHTSLRAPPEAGPGPGAVASPPVHGPSWERGAGVPAAGTLRGGGQVPEQVPRRGPARPWEHFGACPGGLRAWAALPPWGRYPHVFLFPDFRLINLKSSLKAVTVSLTSGGWIQIISRTGGGQQTWLQTAVPPLADPQLWQSSPLSSAGWDCSLSHRIQWSWLARLGTFALTHTTRKSFCKWLSQQMQMKCFAINLNRTQQDWMLYSYCMDQLKTLLCITLLWRGGERCLNHCYLRQMNTEEVVLGVIQQPISIASWVRLHKKWDFIPPNVHKCAYVDCFSCFQGKQQVVWVILALTVAWVLLNNKSCLRSKQSGSLKLHFFYLKKKNPNPETLFVRSYLNTFRVYISFIALQFILS